MNTMIRFFHEEKGSVLSLVAIGLIVILGMAALVLDGGVRYLTQSRLQTAADAAALAGAQLLPLYDEAETVAISIAGANGVSAHEIVVNVPYNDNQSRIEVICTRTLDYSFARVLGFNQGVISARCVAEKYSQWTGEALPFINTEDDYGTDPEAIIWVDTGPGDFGSLNIIFFVDAEIRLIVRVWAVVIIIEKIRKGNINCFITIKVF